MDNYNSGVGKGVANNETNGWESEGFRKLMVKEIAHAIMMTSPLYNISDVMAWVERVEEEMYASSKDKDDLIFKITIWMVSINISSHIPELRPLAISSTQSENASSSTGANERVANINWQEFPHHRVETLRSVYFSKFPQWCRLADTILEQIDFVQLHSAPEYENLRTVHILKCNLLMGLLEMILQHLNVSNGQISSDFKETLDEVEQNMNFILRRTNVSQDAVSSSSQFSHQDNLTELPLMSLQSSHLGERVPDDHQNMVNHKRKSSDNSEEEEEKPMKLMKDEDDDLDSSGHDLSLKL